MGVGVVLSEMFGRGNGFSKLIGINRAFFMQGLLLVSICRRLPDPPPGQIEQEAALKKMLKNVMLAVQAGAKENSQEPGVKEEVETQFERARQGLCAYIDGYGIALTPDRDPTSRKVVYGSNSELISNQMANAKQDDENASRVLKAIDNRLAKKIEEIKKLRKIGISITYYPDLRLPEWDPKNRQSPFIISHEYTSPIYYANNIFKIEERTTIEMLLHRLLQYTKYDQSLDSLSLDRKPELYQRIPDGKHPKVLSLLPLSIVDEYKEKDKTLILTIETKSNKMIKVSDIRSLVPLPSDWRNIWIIGKTDQWVMVRKSDVDFTLRKYTMAEFLEKLEYPPVSIMGNNLYRIPYNASLNQHTSYPQDSQPSGSIITQPTFPQPYYGVSAPPMPINTPIQMPQPQPAVAPPTSHPPPIMSAGPPPAAQAANSSKSSANNKRDTGSTRANSATEAQKAKLLIPDSSSATHHVAGDMRLVGREKKAQASGGGFFSRLFGRS